MSQYEGKELPDVLLGRLLATLQVLDQVKGYLTRLCWVGARGSLITDTGGRQWIWTQGRTCAGGGGVQGGSILSN